MVIPSVWVEMGHHALALEAPLYEMGFLAYRLMEQMRERGEWLERCGSQGTHMGSIMIGREGVF